MMTFTDELKEMTQDTWDRSLNHPFVRGVTDGSLPLEKFKFYILQDIYYLKHYGKVHAFAAAHADDFDVTADLAQKASETAQSELTVHQEHAEILDIKKEEIDNLDPAPTAYAYTSHLYRAALSGSLGEIVAAILPCYWLYADIGLRYQDAEPEPDIYKNWIATYASDWFQESTQDMIQLMNDIASQASEVEKNKFRQQFKIAKEYELGFWEMAYTFEDWISNK